MTVHLYTPLFKPQLTGSDLAAFNCNMAAAAVYADAQTLGALDVTADHMRALSGDASGGTNIEDAAHALAQTGLHLNITIDGALATLDGALRTGFGAIAHGDYDQVPTHLKGDLEFNGTHSVFAAWRDARGTFVYDPLDDGRHDAPSGRIVPKGPIFWPDDVFDHYARKFPRGITYGLTTRARVKIIAKIANIRPTPARSHPPISTIQQGATIEYGRVVLGEVIRGDGRWFRVWDGRIAKIGFIHASTAHTT